MKRALPVMLGVALALLIGFIYLLSGAPGVGSSGGEGASNYYRDGERGFSAPGEEGGVPGAESPEPAVLLANYQKYAKYPPHSRPLSPLMVDLINPWRVKSTPLPVLSDSRFRSEKAVKALIAKLVAQGKSEDEIAAELKRELKGAPTYQFTLNRHTVTEGEELRATLRVLSAAGQALKITLLSATMEGSRYSGSPGLGSVPYEKAANETYNFIWKAPSGDNKYWGNLTLLVRAKIPGVKDEAILRAGFYSSPVAPARFTGDFRERLEKGSLVIDVELDVLRECKFALHANLYSADTNEPTHWVSADSILKVGRRWVSFTFFGKVFRDGGHAGKFELRDLRGTCENMPFPAGWLHDPNRLKDIEKAKPRNEPPLLYIPFTDVKYLTTRAYELGDFSADEWQSPIKERRLKRLRTLADQTPES